MPEKGIDTIVHPGGLESGSPESPASIEDGGNCPTDRLTPEQSRFILDHFELAGRIAERLSKRHQSKCIRRCRWHGL